jgi:hypothetical protein
MLLKSLKKIDGDVSLDAALENMGCNVISPAFKIELDHDGLGFEFPGWSLTEDNDSHFSLVRDS